MFQPADASAMNQAAYPLVGRAGGDVLFRLPTRVVTAAGFAAAAAALAAALPERTHVVNLCTDRLRFALGFAAAVLRGQVSVMTSDRSPARLTELAARYAGLYALTETADGAVLPSHALAMPEDEGTAVVMPAIPAGQLAALVFTSGSTGEPVAHRKPWGLLATRSMDGGAAFGLREAAPVSVVAMVPPQHMYGFETSVLLPLHAAASVWCGAGFYPGDVRAALEAVPAPRLLVTTPLQLRALLAAAIDLPKLERIVSATAPLPAEMAAAAERRWDTRVEEIFGATEVGSIARRRTLDGDVWTAYPGVRLARDGEAVSVSGPFAPAFPLSDLVEVIDPSRFVLLGRRTDVVKLGGRRASLAGLSSILVGIAGVQDGLFVAPDDLEQRPTARLLAFAVAPERSAGEILAALRERVDPVFLPRRVIRVEALPRNDVGKLTDGALARLVAGAGLVEEGRS